MTTTKVWTLELSAFPDDFHFDWLTTEERAKHARFATPHLKKQYLLTRVLSRLALSDVDPSREPHEWVFERTEAGKPFVQNGRPLFNLSNGGELVACIVSSEARDVGIDVEPFNGLETEQWTAKEAYLKARGEGISVRPSRVALSINEGGRVTFDDGKNLDDDAAEWTIAVFRVGSRADHVLAVAIRGRSVELPVILSWPKEA